MDELNKKKAGTPKAEIESEFKAKPKKPRPVVEQSGELFWILVRSMLTRSRAVVLSAQMIPRSASVRSAGSAVSLRSRTAPRSRWTTSSSDLSQAPSQFMLCALADLACLLTRTCNA